MKDFKKLQHHEILNFSTSGTIDLILLQQIVYKYIFFCIKLRVTFMVRNYTIGGQTVILGADEITPELNERISFFKMLNRLVYAGQISTKAPKLRKIFSNRYPIEDLDWVLMRLEYPKYVIIYQN